MRGRGSATILVAIS